jgi:site-specific DNA-cytosine methylase
MRVLELFAGSRSIGRVAESRGHEVFSVDVLAFDNIDLVQDIEFLNLEQIPFKPDLIWASPPCTTFSMSAISHHRYNLEPLSEFARKSDRLVKRTIEILNSFESIYYMENPRALLRKMPYMKGIEKAVVWYCQYNDLSAKPTDIFSNNIRSIFNQDGWQPRPPCFNGNMNCQHEKAPRGSATGTQGKKNNYERSRIPFELCEEILIATEKKLELCNQF